MDNRAGVLVCVTGQMTCERLIKEGAAIAARSGGEIRVVHVAAPGQAILGNHREGEALEYLFRASGEAGADMTVLRAADAGEALAALARDMRAGCVVVGAGRGRDGGVFAERLRALLPGVDVRSVYEGRN